MFFRSRFCLASLVVCLLALGVGSLMGQNTAPVPTTFEIVSPDDGNAASLINTNFDTTATKNHRIFYGGDFFYNGSHNNLGFLGYTGADPNAGKIARGNPNGSRLTLGGTEWGLDPAYPNVGAAYVDNLPGSRDDATSFDSDDLGDASFYPYYRGCNGFIAINEGDTLEIKITGFIDPNNRMVRTSGVVGDYTGRHLKSRPGDGIAGPDSANNVTFSVDNLPAGATFFNNRFKWIPNFIQGNGAADDATRNGIKFVDANISDGDTGSETTFGNEAQVGPGMGELKDSLYVIYFRATDDSGQPNNTAIDSLFILVNDSLPNPPPRFTRRTMLRIDSLDNQQTRTFNYLAGKPDTLFNVWEGDSVVVTFYGEDQDSLQGGTNTAIAFGLLDTDSLLDVPKGGGASDRLRKFTQFTKRPGTVDTLAFATSYTVAPGGSQTSFRIRIQIPYNLAASSQKPDSLVVMVSDGTTIVADTFALRVLNTNRPPIWDADTSNLPSDSALAFSPSPALADPDSVQVVTAFTLNNNQTDSTYFSAYVFDPDFLVRDSLGYPITFTASGNHKGTLNSTTGLNVYLPTETDTVTYIFNIIAKDSYTADQKSATQQIRFRVAPPPTITKVEPAMGSVSQEFVIYGSGFGLFSNSGVDTSKVIFYAPNTQGQRQNIPANIISWSKEKVVASVPSGVPASRYNPTTGFIVPDTLDLMTSIYGGSATYPFTVIIDSTGYENLEMVNITATSATIRYRTSFTGTDSIVVASSSDTLDIHSAAFTNTAKFNGYPTFVEYNGALSEIRSSVEVFHDLTPSNDGIHVVQLEDLSPNTLYRFFIASEGGIFAADSLRNINGPYKPKKIDRSDGSKNFRLDAFRFRTFPVNSSTGSWFILKGEAVYSGGVATNATVTLRVIDKSNPADTSLSINTTVGSDGKWEVNLANLKNSSGTGFDHAAGDTILIKIDGSEKGYEEYTAVRAADSQSPQTIPQIMLVPYVKYEMELKTGLNLVGLPLRLFAGQPNTAHAFLNLISGGTPSISRYVSSTGTQQTITRAVAGSYVGAENYSLDIGSGYFVSVSNRVLATLEGRAYTDSVPVLTFPGAGLYFISRPAQIANLFVSWDALTLLQKVASSKAVIRWNAQLQGYEQYFYVDGSYVGTKFGIDVGQGYILEVSGPTQWNPNQSLTLLAGSAEIENPSAQNSGTGQAIVINDFDLDGIHAGTTAKTLDLNISNVTSSAAVFTWMSGGEDPGRLVLGIPGKSDNLAVYPRLSTLAYKRSYVMITDLKPSTTYCYRIENSSGMVFEQGEGTFATAQIGTGIRPYSMFGRLVNPQGDPLSGMLLLMKLRNPATGVESSLLSAVSDRQGYWVMNLANLKEKNKGLPYSWSEGDEVQLTVLGGHLTVSYSAHVQPGSPHNFALDIQQANPPEQNTESGSKPAPVALPKAFSLSQNFPNPFNPSTTIQFSVPEGAGAQRLRLEIFNLRGQLVNTLADGIYEPGNYQVNWQGQDSQGGRVTSGVYFYRLSTSQFKATRKMVILK